MSTPESRLAELGLVLPTAPPPGGVYAPVVVAGTLAYVSGHGPVRTDGSLITGRVGADLTLDQGRDAARQVGLTILATLRAQLGSLDRVGRVVKLLGMVNATPQFHDHPEGHQRLLGAVCRHLGPHQRRRGAQCRRHGVAAARHRGGDRGDL